MIIFIASDHAGFELKRTLVEFLTDLGHEIVDYGPKTFEPADDYPDFMIPLAKAISGDPEGKRGVIIGGSGQGEAMVANRFPAARAAVYYGGPEEIIKLSREHNNANILSLGARFLDAESAKKAVKVWLDTPFSGDERHMRRIKKIDTALGDVSVK